MGFFLAFMVTLVFVLVMACLLRCSHLNKRVEDLENIQSDYVEREHLRTLVHTHIQDALKE